MTLVSITSSAVRSRRLPRPLSCLAPASFRHEAKSLMLGSRIDSLRSFRRESSSHDLSRVLTRSKAVELLSLLTAAASLSGHSDRFTNSNCASATSAGCEVDPDLRGPVEESARHEGVSPAFASSTHVVSLNSCKVAATLRPMPAVGGCVELDPGLEASDEEEEEDAEHDL